MPQFKRYKVARLLGITPIAEISDSQVWKNIVTPQVQALLGDVVSVDGPHVLETTKGLFPGDENTNLSDHRMYGGLSADIVRFPYVEVLYRTAYGALVIKNDAVRINVRAFFGNIDKGEGQMIYDAALRDRQFDGTRRANDSSLLRFSRADNFNSPLPVGKGVEMSIYAFLPRGRIVDLLGNDEKEFQDFIHNPFRFLGDTTTFLKHFNRAWRGSLAPGQIAPPIPDVSKVVPKFFETVARKAGYDFLENACSHYHVARWAQAVNYRYTYQKDADTVAKLTAGIEQLRANLKAKGTQLTRPQESWACVIQSLRPVELIPEGLYFGGPVWPQDNINPYLLWTNLPLSDNAKLLIPGPLPVRPE